MSEETQTSQVEESQTEQTQVTVDPYEAEAREQGWRPQEEYEGDPGKWRSAKEFVERGELFGKIDTLGKELKDTKKALKMLQEHHTKVRETEYKRAVDELKAAQKKHLEEGNSDAYLEATELLTDLKAEQKAREVVESTKPAQQTGPDPRFTSWVEKNSWYNKDQEMRQFADVVGMGYAQANRDLDPEQVLQYVTAQVKQRFKEKFENPNRNKPSTVEGASSPSNGKKESFELTEDERRVMNTFVRQNLMTKDEYIAQVKSMRGIK